MDNIQQNIPRANLKKKNIARLVLYSELSKYYTMEEIDQMLATISEGGFVDLRSYLKKSEALEDYQQKLVSGENIKTINNQSILGAGNINIQGGGGGIEGITMNGSPVSIEAGVANLGTVVTDKSDKQDTLVSGTNIKTINNQSILGSGNIDIQGGSITIDEEPTEDSPNAVSSGGVYAEMAQDGQNFVNMSKLGAPELNNGRTPNAYSIGDIFAQQIQYDKYIGFAYYVALVAGQEGEPVNDQYKFYYTLSGAEAVYVSLNLGGGIALPQLNLNSDQKAQSRENIGIDLNHIADLDNSGKLPKGQLPEGVVTEYASDDEIRDLFHPAQQQEISGEHAGELSNGEVIGEIDTPIRDN